MAVCAVGNVKWKAHSIEGNVVNSFDEGVNKYAPKHRERLGNRMKLFFRIAPRSFGIALVSSV